MLWLLYFTPGLQYENLNQVAMWPETHLEDYVIPFTINAPDHDNVLFQSLPLYSDVESEIHRPPQHEKVNVSIVKGPFGFAFSLGKQKCEIHILVTFMVCLIWWCVSHKLCTRRDKEYVFNPWKWHVQCNHSADINIFRKCDMGRQCKANATVGTMFVISSNGNPLQVTWLTVMSNQHDNNIPQICSENVMVLALSNSAWVNRTFASEQETLMRHFDYSLVAFIGQYTCTTVS